MKYKVLIMKKKTNRNDMISFTGFKVGTVKRKTYKAKQFDQKKIWKKGIFFLDDIHNRPGPQGLGKQGSFCCGRPKTFSPT